MSAQPPSWWPVVLVLLFLGASLLMIWRLEHMTESGLGGTVLGTLVMPYCSGIGNIVFVFVVQREGLPGTEVMTNCLVNNVTNLTLLMGLPALFWGIPLWNRAKRKARPKAKELTAHRINRLSILLTLVAVLFFTGATWALGRDGSLNRWDGVVLVGLFLFWQCFHVFDVLKTNVREKRSLGWILLLDFSLLLAGGSVIYLTVEGLVLWLSQLQTGFISVERLGWLSGWLMVLPNAILAMYYGWRRSPEIIYSSQVGDGHICIPLCIGLSALLGSVANPEVFMLGVVAILGAVGFHILVVMSFGQLPRLLGWVLLAAYAFFVYRGLA